jgi:hypothetical protein
VGFTEPSDPWVLEIKGLEWRLTDHLRLPLFPHVFMAWYFNQHRDNFTVI